MKKHMFLPVVVAFSLLSADGVCPRWAGRARQAEDFIPPAVFQAAGPTADSIQGTVDEFRAALGNPNNGNDPGPLATGRREINWDGGGNNNTTTPQSRRSTSSSTPVAASSPHRGKGCPKRLRRAGHKAALQCSSTIRPTAPSSAPSVHCACSPRSAATSPRRSSSYPAPMARPRRWSVASGRSSQMLTCRMGARVAGAPTSGPAR